MNNLLQTCGRISFFFISLFYLLTVVNALPPGEIIFVHPSNAKEIWISNAEGTTARKFFRSTFHEIKSMEVQSDGEYVLVLASHIIRKEQIAQNIQRLTVRDDVFILDRKNPDRSARNITQGKYDTLIYAGISEDGDVIFLADRSLHLIDSHEVNRRIPKVELILELDEHSMEYIELSPRGNYLAYVSRKGLCVLDINTKDIFQITQNARYLPIAFSPDASQIAFSMDIRKDGERQGIAIAIAPVQPNPEVEILQFREKYSYWVQAWSPDGKYIAYISYLNPKLVDNIELFRSIRNFVIPASGGEPEPILITIKETVDFLAWEDRTYTVEPDNSLVTTWGKLKQK